MTPVDEDDEFGPTEGISKATFLSSDEDLAKMSGMVAKEINVKKFIEETTNTMETKLASIVVAPTRRQLQILGRALSRLEIPSRDQLFESLDNERDDGDVFQIEFISSGETAQASVFEQDYKISNPGSGDETGIKFATLKNAELFYKKYAHMCNM